MIMLYIFMIGLPCLLIFLLIRKIRNSRKIYNTGIAADAVIRKIVHQRINRSSLDILTLEYIDHITRQVYYAKATTIAGKYKTGDTMPLKYLPQNPAKYSFDNGKYNLVLLILCVLILVFTIFASFKINEMAVTGYYQ